MKTFSLRVSIAILIVATIVVASASTAFMIGRWTAPDAAASHTDAPDMAEAQPEQPTIYYCPMHPDQRSEDPTYLCPICAMELIPLTDDDDDDNDGAFPRLRVSQRAAALMNIQTVPARQAIAERSVRLYGRVQLDERRVRTIAAWTEGRIDEQYITFTGQSVQRDEPMVKLYSPSLISAQEELLQAIRAAEQMQGAGQIARQSANDSVQAARDKLRLLGVAESFIDEIVSTAQVQEHVTIASPLEGTVLDRFVQHGDYVTTGQAMYRVANLAHLWVQMNVFESDLMWISEGQNVTFTSPSYPGRTFEGDVSFIDPQLDERSRSVLVRVDVENEHRLLKPGMFVQGAVHAMLDADGQVLASDDVTDASMPLVIPASAPLITGQRAVVYVYVPGEDRPTFEQRQVVLGPRADDQYIILDGLDSGDIVVTHGAFRIDSELQIRGRPSMMQWADPVPPPAAIVADDHPARAVNPVDVPDGFAQQLQPVLNHYMSLTDALAHDDYETGMQAGHALHDHLYEIDSASIDAILQEAWDAIDQKFHEILHEMLAEETIEELRPHIEPLTEYIALMVAHFIGERAGTVYRVHCPMVDDNRGADWLQRTEAIANPYFGSMMFRCGEVVGEVRYEPPTDPAEQADETATSAAVLDVPAEFAAQIVDVFEIYTQITHALADDDVAATREAVVTMQDALLDLSLQALDDATKSAWLSRDVRMLDALTAMLRADTLDGMRAHLPALTDEITQAITQFASEQIGVVYRVFCPMAFDNQGALWLQQKREIRNPYFGQAMLRCGEAEALSFDEQTSGIQP